MSPLSADAPARAHFPLALNPTIRMLLRQKPTATMALGSITVERCPSGTGFVGRHSASRLSVRYSEQGEQLAPALEAL